VIEIPEPRYATAADGTSLAYQVLGHGRHDIVYLPGNATQLDVMWEHPTFSAFRRRLSGLGRLIMVDRRGVGLSDRLAPEDLPPVEVHVEDLMCVLDTIRSRDTVLFGCDEGAMTAVLTAAAHPDRIRQLVLFGARPSIVATSRHPWGGDRAEWEEWLVWAAEHWGSRDSIVHDMHDAFPSMLSDESAIAFGAKVQRAAASPHAAVALFKISMQLNVADVLPTVRVPTLVLHRRDDVLVPADAGRAVADLIPGATFVEVEGEDHFVDAGSHDSLIESIRSFLRLDVSRSDGSRRLATTLFTDIVGSTERSAQMGDAAWKDLLERHHSIVRAELERARGDEVDTAGDGFFATFDGPAAAARCALAITHAVREIGLEVRAGVHVGEVETIDGKVGGIGVTIGARVGALAGPSEVLVSQTVRDLVAGSGLEFEEAGEHELKGVPDRWRLYRVVR
jgi:class 3 adenylate cyclase/alpha-beta hydrolase superfamily lysophospholipase